MALSQVSSHADCLSHPSEQSRPPCWRAPVQPGAGTVSPCSLKPCAGSCLVLCQPLALTSSACPPALSPCAVSAAGALAGSAVPVFCLGFPARRDAWAAQSMLASPPRCATLALLHAVRGAVAFGCCVAGRDCSAELPQRCWAAADPTQAERKKTSVLGSPASAGPPASQSLACRGSLGILRGNGGAEGWGAGCPGSGLAGGIPLSPLHLLSPSCSGYGLPGACTVPSSPAPAWGFPTYGSARDTSAGPHPASVARAEGGWAPSSSGHPGTGAASTTAATVTVTPTASTRCPSAAPRSTVTCPGTARPAPPPSPPPTAAATRTRSRS